MAERLTELAESISETDEYLEEAQEVLDELEEEEEEYEEELDEIEEDDDDDSEREKAVIEDALENYFPVAYSQAEEWMNAMTETISEAEIAYENMEDAYEEYASGGTDDSSDFWDLENSNPIYLVDVYAQLIMMYGDMMHTYEFLIEAARVQDEMEMDAEDISDELAEEIEKAELALEAVPEILVDTIGSLIDEIEGLIALGEEYWSEMDDIWDEMDDIWDDYLERDWDSIEDAWDSVQSKEIDEFKEKEIELMWEDVEWIKNELDILEAGGVDVTDARAVVAEFVSLLEQMEDAEDWDDIDDLFDDMDDLEDEAMEIFEELGLHDFGVDDKDIYVETIDVNDPEALFELLSTIPENVLEEAIEMLLANVNASDVSALVEYSETFEDVGFFDSASLAFADEEKIDLLIEEKLNHLAELEAKIADYEGTLMDLTNEIAAYNWYGDAADEVDALIASLSSDMSDDEINNIADQIAALKGESIIEKWEDELVPYKDTDDDSWFTGHVWDLTNAGVVSGGTDDMEGYYVPGNDVTIAEILKMALETAGYDPLVDTTPTNPHAQSHWASGYYAKAEELGLAIVSDMTKDPNTSATRGEVLDTLFDAYGVSVPAASTMQFSDVASTHTYANAVQYAYELGIVSGDDGLGETFRPDDSVNRAEVAKIVDQFMEVMSVK